MSTAALRGFVLLDKGATSPVSHDLWVSAIRLLLNPWVTSSSLFRSDLGDHGMQLCACVPCTRVQIQCGSASDGKSWQRWQLRLLAFLQDFGLSAAATAKYRVPVSQ